MDNFIVSARKYRPATFISVIGQGHITSTLKNAILRGQLAHAYLFCGPRGVGKTTCARIFAKAINCLDPKEGEACNECESCKAFNEGRSFSIHELDAASNNSVDDIRTLTEQVRIPPQIGRYSVYIIDEVHMLSLQAFNAFLKTLEEPPAHAVFILATTEKHKIIPTILSRCQIYDFNRIRVEDSVGYLKHIASRENVSFDDEALHIIAQKADGGMRDALSMFDKVVSFCGANLTVAEVAATLNVLDYDTYFKVTGQILAGDYTSALLLLDEVIRKGFSPQTFAAGLNAHFRDLLMCKNPQTLPLLEVTGSVAQRYREQAEQCPVPLLVEGMNLLTSVDSALRTSTNQRLNIELGLMKLCGLGQKKNDDTLTPSLPPLTAGNAGRSATQGAGAVVQQTVSAAGAVQEVTPIASQAEAKTGAVSPAVATVQDPATSFSSAISQASQAASHAVTSSIPATEAPKAAPDKMPDGSAASVAPVTAAHASGPAPTSANHVQAVGSVAASSVPAAEPKTAQAAQDRTPASGGGVSLSGRSIMSILNYKEAVKEESPAQDDEPEEQEEIDQQAEMKLLKACELYAKELSVSRPRIGVIIGEASVNDNMVTLKVPNESSYDEVMHLLTDIQRGLAQIGGLKFPIKFTVTIKADKKGLKPVKVEDRMKFLTAKNPLINDMRTALELDVE